MNATREQTRRRGDLPDWPEAMRIETAADYLDVSRSYFLDLVAAGILPGHSREVKLPGSERSIRLWSRASLRAWVAGAAAAPPPSPAADPWDTR